MLQGGGGYQGTRRRNADLVALRHNPLDPHFGYWTPLPPEAARTTYRRLLRRAAANDSRWSRAGQRPQLVFDEPPRAWMPARVLVWELIDALRRDGVTVVPTTHHLKEAELLPPVGDQTTGDGGRRSPAELMRSGAKDRHRAHRAAALDPVPGLGTARGPATELTPGEYLSSVRLTCRCWRRSPREPNDVPPTCGSSNAARRRVPGFTGRKLRQ